MSREFYAALYEAEWQRRDQLQSAASNPLGVLVILGSGLLVLAREFKSEELLLNALFWPAFLVACASFAVASFQLVRSFHGYEYSRIPFHSQLHRYHEGLKAHYLALGRPGEADEEFDRYLTRRYVHAGNENSVHNLIRGEYLRRANRVIVFGLAATCICAVPYAIGVRTGEAEPQRIEIVNSQRGPDGRQRPAAERSAQAASAAQSQGQHPSEGAAAGS